MYAYIVRRLLFGILIVWGVYTITFLAVNLAPGDPFTGKESAKVTEADLNRLRAKWGYDLPVIRRYFLHLRKMFWSDAEVLDYEGGGLRFDVLGGDGTNLVRALAQEPPDEIVLMPTPESVMDDGASEVRLRRNPDGTYERKPIRNGQYRFGLRKLSVFAADNELDSGGVLIRYDGETGEVGATPTLEAPPADVRLVPAEGGAAVLLTRGADGVFGPVPISPGRYQHEDGAADILVPEKVLRTRGPTFDLGTSIQHNKPVLEYLKPKFWNTIKLGFWALFVNYLVGISLGVISAIRKDSTLDHSVTVSAF
ncbi:MAG: hypothetical protein ACYTG6_06205, partial [Planctomycetota bacterium]